MDPELESVCELVRECGLFMRGADTSELLVNAKTTRRNLNDCVVAIRIEVLVKTTLASVIKNAQFTLIMNKQNASERFQMVFMQMILRQELLINVWKNAKNVIQKVSI